MWVYVHPILGAITLAMLVWLAMLGLRARHKARYAPRNRRLHRRLSSVVFALFLITAAIGLGSTALLRDDLPPAASRHFAAAVIGVVAMIALLGLGRRLPGSAAARRWHPIVGYVALASGAALLILGFSLLP